MVNRSDSPVIEALRQLAESNRAMSDRLQENSELIERGLDMLADGATTADALRAIFVFEAQQAADAAMTELFDARHRLRQLLICEAIDDGMSFEQLASMFRIRPELIGSYRAEGATRMKG
jgi:hypothetical protein